MTAPPLPQVVLLSGGLDSAVALAVARRESPDAPAHAVSFDYGQRHRHELAAAARIAASLGAARHITLTLDLRAVGGSALTDAAIDVPKDRADSDLAAGVPITYVPARNLVFLSLAAGYAETIGARDIFIGVNAVDYSGYPDCREDFIRSFEQTANLATKAGRETSGHFRIRTPLAHLSKAEIIRRGSELGVDFALTHSCYDPVLLPGGTGLLTGVPTESAQPLACGRCDSCVIRRRGFAEANIPDPTRYP